MSSKIAVVLAVALLGNAGAVQAQEAKPKVKAPFGCYQPKDGVNPDQTPRAIYLEIEQEGQRMNFIYFLTGASDGVKPIALPVEYQPSFKLDDKQVVVGAEIDVSEGLLFALGGSPIEGSVKISAKPEEEKSSLSIQGTIEANEEKLATAEGPWTCIFNTAEDPNKVAKFFGMPTD